MKIAIGFSFIFKAEKDVTSKAIIKYKDLKPPVPFRQLEEVVICSYFTSLLHQVDNIIVLV